jgi:hypothetical protein
MAGHRRKAIGQHVLFGGVEGEAEATTHTMLREIVARTGLSQREIAKQVGLHETALCRYLTDKLPVPLLVWQAVSLLALRADLRLLLQTARQDRWALPRALQGLLGDLPAQRKVKAVQQPPKAIPEKVEKPPKRKKWKRKTYDPARWTPPTQPVHPHTAHLHPPSGGIRTVVGSISTGLDDD